MLWKICKLRRHLVPPLWLTFCLAFGASAALAGTAGTLDTTELDGGLTVSFILTGSDFSGTGPAGAYDVFVGFTDGVSNWTAQPVIVTGPYLEDAIFGVAWADPADPGNYNILNMGISGSGPTGFLEFTDAPLSDEFQGCYSDYAPVACPVLANGETIQIPISENPDGGRVYEGTLATTWNDLDGVPEPCTGLCLAPAIALLALTGGMRSRKAPKNA
jgi:hypothetical protein